MRISIIYYFRESVKAECIVTKHFIAHSLHILHQVRSIMPGPKLHARKIFFVRRKFSDLPAPVKLF